MRRDEERRSPGESYMCMIADSRRIVSTGLLIGDRRKEVEDAAWRECDRIETQDIAT